MMNFETYLKLVQNRYTYISKLIRDRLEAIVVILVQVSGSNSFWIKSYDNMLKFDLTCIYRNKGILKNSEPAAVSTYGTYVLNKDTHIQNKIAEATNIYFKFQTRQGI